jgi:hypothetical protein
VLFGLAAVAARTHVSIMLAGFSLGIAATAVGEPRRVAKQLFAITEGFSAPLLFVWLGASLNLRDLASHPSYLLLGVALGFGAVGCHAAMRLTRQPLDLGALAAAQLGVPIAAATLGTQLHLLRLGEPAALILGALVTIGCRDSGRRCCQPLAQRSERALAFGVLDRTTAEVGLQRTAVHGAVHLAGAEPSGDTAAQAEKGQR